MKENLLFGCFNTCFIDIIIKIKIDDALIIKILNTFQFHVYFTCQFSKWL